MFTLSIRIFLIVLITFVLSSCTATKDVAMPDQPVQSLLVGVTSNYPPVIFKQGGEFTGIEADLARLLAAELGKSVQFVELRWEDQIPSLMAGKTDIIMSGMSVTNKRKIRVNFTDHYLKSGLVVMMRVEDAPVYNSIENIQQSLLQVGVVKGTTSDIFIRKNFPNAMRIASYQNARDAVAPLKNKSLDIFVHDAPSIMWLVSENEADLTAFNAPLNEENLAWGVRRDDPELLMQINSILGKWKNDGTLNRVLLRWLPSQYMERFK